MGQLGSKVKDMPWYLSYVPIYTTVMVVSVPAAPEEAGVSLLLLTSQ